MTSVTSTGGFLWRQRVSFRRTGSGRTTLRAHKRASPEGAFAAEERQGNMDVRL